MAAFIAARTGQRIDIDLNQPPLGKGGEGRVFRVEQRNLRQAAKIFHLQDAEAHWKKELQAQRVPIPKAEREAWLDLRRQSFRRHIEKLDAMLANPPEDIGHTLSQQHSFTWPTDILRSADGSPDTYGYLMPLVQSDTTLHRLAHGSERIDHRIACDYRQLFVVGARLAKAVSLLHSKGYVIGDIKDQNVLVQLQSLQVTIIDTDSFQVPLGGQTFPCRVYSEEYSPPERPRLAERGMRLPTSYDWYSLGVLLFLLLQDGLHPFFSEYSGSGAEPPVDHQQKMQLGYFPFAKKPRAPYRPYVRGQWLWQALPAIVRDLFVRCFEEGHDSPAKRPTAFDWREALEAVSQPGQYLIRCARIAAHFYDKSLGKECPWCRYEALTKCPSFIDAATNPSVTSKPVANPIPHSAHNPISSSVFAPNNNQNFNVASVPKSVPDPSAVIPQRAVSQRQAPPPTPRRARGWWGVGLLLLSLAAVGIFQRDRVGPILRTLLDTYASPASDMAPASSVSLPPLDFATVDADAVDMGPSDLSSARDEAPDLLASDQQAGHVAASDAPPPTTDAADAADAADTRDMSAGIGALFKTEDKPILWIVPDGAAQAVESPSAVWDAAPSAAR